MSNPALKTPLRYAAVVGAAIIVVGTSTSYSLQQASTHFVSTGESASPRNPARPSYLAGPPVVPAAAINAVKFGPPAGTATLYVAPATPTSTAEPEAASTLAHIGIEAANVRSGPGKANAKVFVVHRDEQVATLETKGSWTLIRNSGGETGWVFDKFLVR